MKIDNLSTQIVSSLLQTVTPAQSQPIKPSEPSQPAAPTPPAGGNVENRKPPSKPAEPSKPAASGTINVYV